MSITMSSPISEPVLFSKAFGRNFGVHPDRISHRGYGEALPKNLGQDEASLSENRRVEFHIVRIDPEDTELDLRPLEKSPWDGSNLEVITPQKNVGSDDTDNPFNTDVMVPDDFFNPDNPIPEMNSEEDQIKVKKKIRTKIKIK